MSSVVSIINRLPAGKAVFHYALEVTRRLRAAGLACIAVQSRRGVGEELPITFIGNPEVGLSMGCLPPDCWDGVSRISDADIARFFEDCEAQAQAANTPCETLTHRGTLSDAIGACHTFFGLVCLSRESLFDDSTHGRHIFKFLSWTPRPLLICPPEYREWRRIIVASSSQRDFLQLVRWSRHWSRIWGLLCDILPPPMASNSKATFSNRCGAWCEEWLPGLSMSRAKWQAATADRNFNDDDLLLVGRDATLRPLPFGQGIRLQNLLRVFPGSVGILPSPFVGSVSDLLVQASEPGLLSRDSVIPMQVA